MSSIYSEFTPTFLYIKQHKITGKLYFGKTSKNPETYKGSGIHWKSHLKKHGNEVETLWYCLYNTKESIKEAAISFSKLWDIVESDEWLNLIEEDGLCGGDTSHTENFKKYTLDENKILKTHRWWNNGQKQVFLPRPPDSSYILGRLPFNNLGAQIGADIQKQKHWITNGQVEYMAEKYLDIPEGYYKGRLKSKAFNGFDRSSTKGVKWWNNGKIEKMSFNQPDDTFIMGRISRSNLDLK